MKPTKTLRKYWHDAYYALASDRAVTFAMLCRDVAHEIDLAHADHGWSEKVRLRLHLSLCQACKNYFDVSVALKEAAEQMRQASFVPIDVDRE